MKRLAVGVILSALASASQADTVVFFEDFNSAIPASVAPGTATLTGVQAYNGLGPSGNQFGGSFLRSATANTVTLTLTGLPDHSTISLGLLFAAIDSLDGTGSPPSDDFFKVTLDGTQIFRESFANALPSQVQSYSGPSGTELARHQDLGFSGPGSYYTDSAYNFAVDPVFQNISHSGSTAVFIFVMEGTGVQDLNDESWAMDNLQVSVNAVPLPAGIWLLLSGVGGLAAMLRRRVRA